MSQGVDEPEKLVSPGAAAKRLHVHTRTLQRMADRGDVQSVRLPSGHRRYRLSDIERLAGVAA